MKVVIIGCGRVGSAVALELEKEGHEISVLDENKEAFDRLGKGFKGRKHVGVALSLKTLEEAHVGDADVCLLATDGDNTNVVVAQVAMKKFGVPCVAARVLDPVRAEFYRTLGVRTLSPTGKAIDDMLEMARSCPRRDA